uniref:Uncharacterized protein n=1 Tax=Knipowitschia caucasica TaxID=637954 RepID=A0AAV2JEL5_KNICA
MILHRSAAVNELVVEVIRTKLLAAHGYELYLILLTKAVTRKTEFEGHSADSDPAWRMRRMMCLSQTCPAGNPHSER